MANSTSVLRVVAVVSSILLATAYLSYQIHIRTAANAQTTKPGSTTTPSPQLLPGSKSFKIVEINEAAPPPTTAERTTIMLGSKSATPLIAAPHTEPAVEPAVNVPTTSPGKP
jgi:hypothetical protein